MNLLFNILLFLITILIVLNTWFLYHLGVFIHLFLFIYTFVFVQKHEQKKGNNIKTKTYIFIN